MLLYIYDDVHNQMYGSSSCLSISSTESVAPLQGLSVVLTFVYSMQEKTGLYLAKVLAGGSGCPIPAVQASLNGNGRPSPITLNGRTSSKRLGIQRAMGYMHGGLGYHRIAAFSKSPSESEVKYCVIQHIQVHLCCTPI